LQHIARSVRTADTALLISGDGVMNASSMRSDAIALVGALLLAMAAPTATAADSDAVALLGVLLLVAADGVRFPVPLPSQPYRATPMHKQMLDGAASAGGMPGIKPQLPCWGGEAHRERVGQLVEWRSSRHRFFLMCADDPVAPMPRREEFRRHGAGNWLMRNP
jgi:hypothetical protein